MATENTRMRLRLWVGLVCVVLIAAGSVAAALVVHSDDTSDFHQMQLDEAMRAGPSGGIVGPALGRPAGLAAAFFQVEGHVDKHEFAVISRSLLKQDVLTATALIERVPAAQRGRLRTPTRLPDHRTGRRRRRAAPGRDRDPSTSR